MQESKVAGELVQYWIPVVGADGRTHMEARWHVVGEAHAVAPHAA